MAADGEIIIEAQVDNRKAQAELNKLTAKIRKLKNDLQTAQGDRNALEQQFEEASAAAEETRHKIKELEEQLKRTTDPADKADIKEKLKSINLEFREEAKQATQLNNALTNQDNKIAGIEQNIAQSELVAGQYSQQLAQANTPLGKMQSLTEQAGKKMEKFGNRIKKLASRVFVFTLITMALRKLRQGLFEAIKENEQVAKSFESLKEAGQNLFGTIANAIAPAVIAVAQWLTYVINLITNLISTIFKVQKYSKKATSGAGGTKALERQIAGFDEINKLNDNESGGGAGDAGAGMDAITEEMRAKLAAITALVGASLMAIGAILLFTGHIGLGLALLIAGFAMLYAAVKEDWDKVPTETQLALAKILAIVGGALIAIGAVFLLTGNIPLGLGLLVGGLVAEAAAVTVSWTALPQKVKSTIAEVLAIVGTALLVIGFIFLCSGNFALGLGLMAAGGLAAYTAYKMDWDGLRKKVLDVSDKVTEVCIKFRDKIKEILDTIKQKVSDFADRWRERWQDIWQAVAEWAQPIVDVIQNIIGWVQSAINWIGGLFSSGGSVSISAGAYGGTQSMSASVPHLAAGAVIPPNREFLAVLGDQSSGQNIEAPASLIREIVRQESGTDVMRDMLQAIRELDLVVNLNDKIIAESANRGQRQLNRAYGR